MVQIHSEERSAMVVGNIHDCCFPTAQVKCVHHLGIGEYNKKTF